ncbi:hypothetical protein ACLOJK_037215 [Asimina triloba]
MPKKEERERRWRGLAVVDGGRTTLRGVGGLVSEGLIRPHSQRVDPVPMNEGVGALVGGLTIDDPIKQGEVASELDLVNDSDMEASSSGDVNSGDVQNIIGSFILDVPIELKPRISTKDEALSNLDAYEVLREYMQKVTVIVSLLPKKDSSKLSRGPTYWGCR